MKVCIRKNRSRNLMRKKSTMKAVIKPVMKEIQVGLNSIVG
jgi:hypothetical protein